MTGRMSQHVTDILSNEFKNVDIDALERVGWYIRETESFISVLFKNMFFQNKILLFRHQSILFDPSKPDDNAIMAIAAGFLLMNPGDFKLSSSISTIDKFPIENSLSYKWSLGVSKSIGNASLWFQQKSEISGYVDFYLNGYSDCAIEFIRNATITKNEGSCRQSSDIDGHLERFTSGQYPWKRFFIVNFSLIQKEPVLPSNSR